MTAPADSAAPAGYSRATYLMHNDLMRPLDERDARGLLGAEITAALNGTVLSSGTVTDAVVVDEGRRIQVTIESGGRRCALCGRIYSPEQVSDGLEQGDMTMPDALSPWLLTCKEQNGCQPRRARTPTDGPV